MANISLTPQAGHENLSPQLFHLYACEYLNCESTFKSEAKYSPVPYFLLCLAIELEFKATHLETRSREVVRKKYWHNLTESYDDLPSNLRVLDSSEYKVLEHASRIYNTDKGFEYVSIRDAATGLKDFPELAALRAIATKVIEYGNVKF